MRKNKPFSENIAKSVETVVNEIKPLLAGVHPIVVSAALADCAAILIGGHFVPGSVEKTQALRDAVYANHIKLIRQLIEVNAIHSSDGN